MPAEVRNGEAGTSAHSRVAKSTNAVNADGLSECFRVVRTSMYVSLAPSHITNPINGIKAQHLDPLVMSYFAKANGVVLAYSNITLNSEERSPDANDIILAPVSDSSPFCFMWVTVDLLLWYPQIGDILEGNVYMQTASHIGLLVHDTFNASIKLRSIPQDWQFVPSQADEFGEADEAKEKPTKFGSYGYWTDASGSKIEGKVLFTVRSIHTSRSMLSIEGTLLSPESELDAQPVLAERRLSATAPVATGKHMKFDDEPIATAEVAEPTTDTLPQYEANDDAAMSTSSAESDSD